MMKIIAVLGGGVAAGSCFCVFVLELFYNKIEFGARR